MKFKTKFGVIAAIVVAIFTLIGCGDTTTGGTDTIKFEILLDADGGTISQETIQVIENSVAQLPTPFKKGFEFQGWYTEDGEPWDLTTQIKDNTSLFAKWSLNGHSLHIK